MTLAAAIVCQSMGIASLDAGIKPCACSAVRQEHLPVVQDGEQVCDKLHANAILPAWRWWPSMAAANPVHTVLHNMPQQNPGLS